MLTVCCSFFVGSKAKETTAAAYCFRVYGKLYAAALNKIKNALYFIYKADF